MLPQPLPEDYQPLMLLVLNSTDKVEWEDLQAKVTCGRVCFGVAACRRCLQGKALASQIAKPLSRFRQHLVVRKPPPLPSAVTSPARAR